MFIRYRNFKIDIDVEWPRAHDATPAILVAARLKNTLGSDSVFSRRMVWLAESDDLERASTASLESGIVKAAGEVIADIVDRLDEGLGFTCRNCYARYRLTKGGRLRPIENDKGDAQCQTNQQKS